jgi:hypothetical protein
MLTNLDKIKAVLSGIIVAFILAFFVKQVQMVADMPDVHFSWTTEECVKVLNYAEDNRYTCDDLPKRYNHVWVL